MANLQRCIWEIFIDPTACIVSSQPSKARAQIWLATTTTRSVFAADSCTCADATAAAALHVVDRPTCQPSSHPQSTHHDVTPEHIHRKESTYGARWSRGDGHLEKSKKTAGEETRKIDRSIIQDPVLESKLFLTSLRHLTNVSHRVRTARQFGWASKTILGSTIQRFTWSQSQAAKVTWMEFKIERVWLSTENFPWEVNLCCP